MAHWLFKSEPSVWSLRHADPSGRAKGTEWSGIRNHSAKLNMMAMQVGEKGFFYHSNEGKAIVGIVEVTKLFYPDPSDETGKFAGMVDIRAVEPFPNPVSLDSIKADKRLAKMELVVNSRLSVQKVTDAEWKHIRQLGGL